MDSGALVVKKYNHVGILLYIFNKNNIKFFIHIYISY